MDDKSISATIKQYLDDARKHISKREKADIAKQLFDYLCEHPDYVNKHSKFKTVIQEKCEEMLIYHQEFNDLIQSVNKAVELFKFHIQIQDFEDLKVLNDVNFNQACTIYEYIRKDINNIIIKLNNEFKGFGKSNIVNKSTNTIEVIFNNKKIKVFDIHFLEEKHKFYELIHSGEDLYFLVPYEMKTFIKKCK